MTIEPQPGPQTAFLSSPCDIAIYGGAAGGGKSWALLMEPIRHVKIPDFSAVFFRRTTVQVRNPGGLWDESCKLYFALGAEPISNIMEWRFPSGAKVKFSHLEHETDKLGWQGAQVPLLAFDELTHFTEDQFWYLLSRNRSTCGIRPYVRATCNPDADSWVASLIDWWLDKDGFAIPERSGVPRYFVRTESKIEWADSRQELIDKYDGLIPKSLTFIPAKVTDNEKLLSVNPEYVSTLMALPKVDRERLLNGNWKIKYQSGNIFNQHWFKIVDAVPTGMKLCRAWDLAASKDSGDWTCGVLAGMHNGVTYMLDVVRLRGSPLDVQQAIVNTASKDGPNVKIRLPQDPGQAGKSQAQSMVRMLVGYDVRTQAVTGDKITRASALSAQTEAGNVALLRGNWNADFIDELCSFPSSSHDDQVDAAADAFNELMNNQETRFYFV